MSGGSPEFNRGIVLRVSGGPSIFGALSNEQLVVDIQDAVRPGAVALAVGAFIGTEYETQTVHNLTRLVDLGTQYGIPVLAVTATEDEAPRDASNRTLSIDTRKRGSRCPVG